MLDQDILEFQDRTLFGRDIVEWFEKLWMPTYPEQSSVDHKLMQSILANSSKKMLEKFNLKWPNDRKFLSTNLEIDKSL